MGGVINTAGEEVIPVKYGYLEDFMNDRAAVKIKGKLNHNLWYFMREN